MRIEKLKIENFGPFKKYELIFPLESDACLLLTGKNNEGKTTILNAIKLLNNATKVVGKKKQEIRIDGDFYYALLKQDTDDLILGRLINDYNDDIAKITGYFSGDFEMQVIIDPSNNKIYTDSVGVIPKDIEYVFGFIPPLGPLAENEEIINKFSYLKSNTNNSIAPRHLRNYFYQLLTEDQFALIRIIVNSSWNDIELEKYEVNYQKGSIDCFYKEKKITREISWAGQGLQVWFQIITHLVRLLDHKILILDEPEINLHPEKQNDLIRILREYFHGGIIIATHSVELMNNVNISHIINVRKNQTKPKVKSTKDRLYLENVRESVGSNFNFIASQFEEVDLLVFTEDLDDYSFVYNLANNLSIKVKSFNIPLHGFSQNVIAPHYKNAYKLLIGKEVDSVVLLDRDYYPDNYLNDVKTNLEKSGLRVQFTSGKEIENIFINPNIYEGVIDGSNFKIFISHLDSFIESMKVDIISDYIGINIKYNEKKGVDPNTIIKKLNLHFEKLWNTKKSKYELVPGKKVLREIRRYFQNNHGINLSNSFLVSRVLQKENPSVSRFIKSIYNVRE